MHQLEDSPLVCLTQWRPLTTSTPAGSYSKAIELQFIQSKFTCLLPIDLWLIDISHLLEIRTKLQTKGEYYYDDSMDFIYK